MHENSEYQTLRKRVLWSAIPRAATESLMLRLDASAYCNTSRQLTIRQQEKAVRLDSLATVHQSIIFGKRAMLGSAGKGIPVYSSSGMLMLNPEPAFYLSRRFESKVTESMRVKKGWVLVSRTGSIGHTLFVPEERDGWLVDDHMIRIIPHEHPHGALLYTYLSSPPGQQALQSLSYGAVQSVIKDIQIEGMQTPLPPEHVLGEIVQRIDRASSNRTQAGKLLETSSSELLRVIGLPDLQSGLKSQKTKWSQAETFEVETQSLKEGSGDHSEYRLDAHFYNPTAQLAITNIRNCRQDVTIVGDVTDEIRMSPLFVRKYVQKEYGVPYIAGKQLSQIHPEFKYISKAATEDLDLHILREGWTLVTCAGSVGKVGYVSGPLVNAAAQDVMRVIPDSTKVDGGYLNAWLASEYGRVLIERSRYGSVVDRVSPQHIASVLIPLPPFKEQEVIGDKVREAYEKRAEAIRLEGEAQAILMNELTTTPESKGA